MTAPRNVRLGDDVEADRTEKVTRFIVRTGRYAVEGGQSFLAVSGATAAATAAASSTGTTTGRHDGIAAAGCRRYNTAGRGRRLRIGRLVLMAARCHATVSIALLTRSTHPA